LIYKLDGLVDEVYENLAVISSGGVGYGVFAPSRVLASLCAGERASLFIETIVREDSITLYGFASRGEKELFLLLTSVQGIGPKAAIAILSALSAQEIAAAISAGDHGVLACANGIGPKSAQRIVAELRDKIAKLGIAPAGALAGAPLPSQAEDAVSALVNLGYSRSAAVKNVAAALEEASEGASIGDIIRRALSLFN
jgi:Holliday junction DNA helicase RuvA